MAGNQPQGRKLPRHRLRTADMTVDMIDACHRRHPFAVRLFLVSKASRQFLSTGRGLLARRFAQGLLAHHHPLAIKGQHLNRLGMRSLLDFLRAGLGIKGVKVLGRGVDDLLHLTLANAHAGFRFDVVDDPFKGLLHRLDGHPLLQPMRVAIGGEVQLRVPWKEARHPALAITRARQANGTKHTLIADFHLIALMRANHAVRATHRFSKPPRALVIQMLLEQQPQQFSAVRLQIRFNFTVRLVAGRLSAQMVRDLDKLLIGGMKWLVNRDNLCFHRTGPLLLRVGGIQWLSTP